MARAFCPDRTRASIAVVAAVLLLFSTVSAVQIAAIALGGVAGFWLCRGELSAMPVRMAVPVSRQVGLIALAAFLLLLIGLPVLHVLTGSHSITLFDAFYRSGALVFGGGHVVLPLLHEAVVAPGWVHNDTFLAGYGAAQAVPGPLFTFAVYLGAVAAPSPHGIVGGIIALIAIFLPGILVLIGACLFGKAYAVARPHKRSCAASMLRS